MNIYNNFLFRHLEKGVIKNQKYTMNRYGYSVVDQEKYDAEIFKDTKFMFWFTIILLIIVIGMIISNYT